MLLNPVMIVNSNAETSKTATKDIPIFIINFFRKIPKVFIWETILLKPLASFVLLSHFTATTGAVTTFFVTAAALEFATVL